MNWEPLTHRVFFDVSTTVKKVLEENNFLSSHDDHTDTATSAASVQVEFQIFNFFLCKFFNQHFRLPYGMGF